MKNWPPTKRYVERLERKAARVDELENEILLRDFVENALARKIMTKLAYTPFSEWPEFCKSAFSYAEHEAPSAARHYKNMLPQSKETLNVDD